jgi:hypothetical protein
LETQPSVEAEAGDERSDGMAGQWTSERFPQFEMEIRRLTEQHLVRRNDYQVLHSDALGSEIFDLIKKAAGSREVASHG